MNARSETSGKATRRPNVIFFFTDDQRFDTIRALGNDEIITPNLDALLAQGTTLTNAYIMGGTCPAVCMPSRAMLHTGRTLFHIDGFGQTVPEEHVLLGEAFRQAGYATFGTGKWHNSPPAYARSFSAGAEIFFGGMSDHWNVPACDFDPTGRYEQQPFCPDPWRSNEVRYRHGDHILAGRHSSDLFAEAAETFIRRHGRERPFFLYLSYMAPHDPRTMPQEYLQMYDPDRIELPPNFLLAHPFDNGELRIRDELLEQWPRTPEAIRRHIAEYYAMITHLDATLGRTLRALREAGLEKDTLLVFSGDNGLAVGRHGLMGKQNLYEHSVHVPLIFAGPSVPKGDRREAFCYLSDVFPTLCELAGLSVPASVDGRSLLPVLRDRDASVRDSLFFAYRDVQRAVREERWKLIEYVVGGRRKTQLFDLASDPWELRSLAEDPSCAVHVRRLRERLMAWRDELDDRRDSERAFWEGFDAPLAGE